MNIRTAIRILTIAFLAISRSLAGLEPGDLLRLTVRGIAPEEQQKINGEYRVGETGGVRLPLLPATVGARGLTPEQFARAAETAYRNAGIYTRPAIEVETIRGETVDNTPTVISVGGHVRRAGETQYRKGITVIQALDAVGGRNEFGGRNIMLLRAGKQYCLDFKNLSHKNIVLQPGDSLQVEQVGVIDRWKGTEQKVKELLK